MDLLVGVHGGGDYNPGINAARISLDAKRIKDILKLSVSSSRMGHGYITTWDSTPDLGTSDLDLENQQVKDISKLSKEETQQLVFTSLPNEGRSDVVQLHVDGTDFWWEGVFKHTDVHWETRLIPLSILPQPITKKRIAALQDAMPFEADRTGYLSGMVQSGSLPDLNMTTQKMNDIHVKIAAGMNHGLNAREIERTFNRHVTKAQLIRCLMEIIDRDHN